MSWAVPELDSSPNSGDTRYTFIAQQTEYEHSTAFAELPRMVHAVPREQRSLSDLRRIAEEGPGRLGSRDELLARPEL